MRSELDRWVYEREMDARAARLEAADIRSEELRELEAEAEEARRPGGDSARGER